jgi:PAS domain S-box-containing protein
MMNDSRAALLDFKALLEAAPDGIAVVDENGTILVVNSQLCNLFGYSPAELSGQRVEVLVPSRLRAGHAGHRRSYDSRPTRRPMGLGLDLVGLRKDGNEFPLEISLSPVMSGDRSVTIATVRDVTERRRLEAEQEAMRSMLDTEQERYRIGMDLHDGIMQDIYAATLALDMAYEDIDQDPGQAKHVVGRSIEQLQRVIQDIRSYIFDLRPRQFTGDLRHALIELGREFEENSAIETRVSAPTEMPAIEHQIGVTLYVIAHEALSNTRKYAAASEVLISLEHSDGLLHLDIRDDGSGFDASAAVSESHRGLRNMVSRAGVIGADLGIESAPGRGTVVHAKVDLDSTGCSDRLPE